MASRRREERIRERRRLTWRWISFPDFFHYRYPVRKMTRGKPSPHMLQDYAEPGSTPGTMDEQTQLQTCTISLNRYRRLLVPDSESKIIPQHAPNHLPHTPLIPPPPPTPPLIPPPHHHAINHAPSSTSSIATSTNQTLDIACMAINLRI